MAWQVEEPLYLVTSTGPALSANYAHECPGAQVVSYGIYRDPCWCLELALGWSRWLTFCVGHDGSAAGGGAADLVAPLREAEDASSMKTRGSRDGGSG